MKHMATLFCGCALIATTAISCKKDNDHDNHPSARTVHYQLYTEKDFSDIQDTITFRLVIAAGSVKLFDSTLAPMRISEIPNKANMLGFHKTVPAGHEKTELRVGFLYSIKDVGESWHLETYKPGAAERTVEFSFQ